MRPTDFEISPQHRAMAAVLVLSEAEYLVPGERGKLLDAMWEGWRKVIRIKIRAETHGIDQKGGENPP